MRLNYLYSQNINKKDKELDEQRELEILKETDQLLKENHNLELDDSSGGGNGCMMNLIGSTQLNNLIDGINTNQQPQQPAVLDGVGMDGIGCQNGVAENMLFNNMGFKFNDSNTTGSVCDLQDYNDIEEVCQKWPIYTSNPYMIRTNNAPSIQPSYLPYEQPFIFNNHIPLDQNQYKYGDSRFLNF